MGTGPLDPLAATVTLTGAVTLADVEALHQLPALRSLHLDCASGVTDELVAVVCRLEQLESLDLSGTGITDAGAAHLARLTRLGSLRIKETAIGDRAAFWIAKLAALKSLNLKQTRLGDFGVRQLERLYGLELVVLTAPRPGGSKFTREGIRRLRAALPDCEVIVQGWDEPGD
jgi:hypothetical protein